MKRNILLAVTAVAACAALAACSKADVAGTADYGTADPDAADSATASGAADSDAADWTKDYDPRKEAVGYYRRTSVVKDGETYEEMLQLRDVGNRGYLIMNDDYTACFDLDGVKTEYVFDKKYLYPAEDTARSNGITYTYIGGKLVLNDGSTVSQYQRMTDEEIASYLEGN